MDPNEKAILDVVELCGEVGELVVSDFERPVKFGSSFGTFFLLLPQNASSRAAWECGGTLFAIPCAGDPTDELQMMDLLTYPQARKLRVASLAQRGGILRVDLRLSEAVE